jgi:uncharacterized protein (TIGR01777 family)
MRQVNRESNHRAANAALKSVVMTGASGFIGKALLMELVRRGCQVTALAREPARLSTLPCAVVKWNGRDAAEPQLLAALRSADAVIHLTGEPVAQARWSSEVRTRIYESRILSTRALVEALATLGDERRCRTLLCASAIGLYGDCEDTPLSETSEPGSDFLAWVVRDWEQAAREAVLLGTRVVLPRLGVVLGAGGGALEQMKPVVLGSGRQWVSWVHLYDVVRFLLFALDDSRVSGAFNLTAPNPVRNAALAAALAESRGALVVPRVPAWALGLLFGEMSKVVLGSTRALPSRTQTTGFHFKYPTLDAALAEIHPPAHRKERRLLATQFLPRSVQEIFPYFSRAENLEELTPPWLKFRILSKSTPDIKERTLIDYRLRIHGFPMHWRTCIESFVPNQCFVDTQLRGPYARWHHTHSFEEVPGGTFVHDEVFYRLPGGALGDALAGFWVRRDVEQIFAYRRRKLAEVFRA